LTREPSLPKIPDVRKIYEKTSNAASDDPIVRCPNKCRIKTKLIEKSFLRIIMGIPVENPVKAL